MTVRTSMRQGMFWVLVLLVALIGVALPAWSTATPVATMSSLIDVPYAKKVIRGYINKEFDVAQGPYFGPCTKLAANAIRCEVEFKAGLFWRCGRVSVRNSGGYDYINGRLPIGC